MSVHVISWVLTNSEAKLGDRLVLIVLADHAKADGTAAWPSVATIGAEARLSRSQVQRCLRNLETSGSIVATGKSRRGTTIFTVAMGPQNDTPRTNGVANATSGGRNLRPEPSLEQPSVPPQTSSVVAASRIASAQDVVADVVDVFSAHSIPLSQRHRGMLGKQAADLLESGFEHEVVVLACVMAIRRGSPQNAHFIASDLVVTHAGQRITRREYERALQDEQEIAARSRHGRS